MNRHRILLTCGLLLSVCTSSPATVAAATPGKLRVLARLVWQDDDQKVLKTADLLNGDSPQLGPVSTVAEFPKLDAERQTLVQMEAARGLILLGVRDDDGGKFQSGWVLIDSGVDADEHGDHAHWKYNRNPRVRAALLDANQGNPAHLYCYDDSFFLANDRLDGFTWLDPQAIAPTDDASAIRRKAAFHQGGGGHITLAAANRKTAWSSWIDRDGPNKGRVDITALSPAGNRVLTRTFFLPSGGIHGATACAGKVFLAPADGICWIDAEHTAVEPKVHHLSLGKDGERPRRTGGFTTFGRHVAFVSGGGEAATLGLVDASQSTPAVVTLPIRMAAGNRPAGLEIVQPRRKSPQAFVFHDHEDGTEAPNRLTIVELDPNDDGSWQDARAAHETDVGKARVEGHGGHHCIAFDADRRRAIFSNPGDGTLTVMTLHDRKVVGQFKVGGAPSKVLAIGGVETND